MLGMDAALAALVGEGAARGSISVASVSTSRDRLLPGAPSGSPGLAMRPARGDLRVLLVRDEHLAGVGPEGVERVLHPAVALGRTVAEADHEVRRPLKVVGDLLDGLLCDLGDARVRGSREAPSGARSGRRRRGIVASACGRSRRSGARQEVGCGSPRRRADRRGRRPSGPCPRPRPARPSHIWVWPIRSSATLASAMSSSSAGEWPHHSEDAVAEDQRRVADPEQGLEEGVLPVASGVGISVWWLRDAASRASSATSGVFMSGSDGILHVPHFFGDVVEGRVAVDLGVRRLEERAFVRTGSTR